LDSRELLSPASAQAKSRRAFETKSAVGGLLPSPIGDLFLPAEAVLFANTFSSASILQP
jgi:hypothetical protein